MTLQVAVQTIIPLTDQQLADIKARKMEKAKTEQEQ
jgi:hypothetical protein